MLLTGSRKTEHQLRQRTGLPGIIPSVVSWPTPPYTIVLILVTLPQNFSYLHNFRSGFFTIDDEFVYHVEMSIGVSRFPYPFSRVCPLAACPSTFHPKNENQTLQVSMSPPSLSLYNMLAS